MTGSGGEGRRYRDCPVCASAIRRWRSKEAEGVRYDLDECVSCGFAFVNPRPSPETVRALYGVLGHGGDAVDGSGPDLALILAKEAAYPNSSLDARRMVRTVASLVGEAGGKGLLDVGCGYGFSSKAALEAGFAVTALEMAETERRIAGEMTGLAPVAASFEAYDSPPGAFSAVLMSQVLEHAEDPVLWVEKARTLLAPGGVLAVALPNFGSLFRLVLGERDPYVCPPAHLNYFDRESLSALLRRHGFRVESVEWVSRVPAAAVGKRLPSFAKPLLPVAAALASAALAALDALRLGMMVNVYARRER